MHHYQSFLWYIELPTLPPCSRASLFMSPQFIAGKKRSSTDTCIQSFFFKFYHLWFKEKEAASAHMNGLCSCYPLICLIPSSQNSTASLLAWNLLWWISFPVAADKLPNETPTKAIVSKYLDMFMYSTPLQVRTKTFSFQDRGKSLHDVRGRWSFWQDPYLTISEGSYISAKTKQQCHVDQIMPIQKWVVD